MASGITHAWTRLWLPLVALLLALQITGCGDKEPEQRKAFIDFLQNTVMRSGEHLPSLSEDQKQRFGNYTADYAIIYGFSQQVNKAVEEGIRPVVDSLSAIHVPQDYLARRDVLRQSSGSLNILFQQIQSAKSQADGSKTALKQPSELKGVYDKIYNNVVSQPANTLIPLLPSLLSLSQNVVQAGDFLQQQGTRVSFDNNGVQFPTQEQAGQYNAIMSELATKIPALSQAQNLVQGGFQ